MTEKGGVVTSTHPPGLSAGLGLLLAAFADRRTIPTHAMMRIVPWNGIKTCNAALPHLSINRIVQPENRAAGEGDPPNHFMRAGFKVGCAIQPIAFLRPRPCPEQGNMTHARCGRAGL